MAGATAGSPPLQFSPYRPYSRSKLPWHGMSEGYKMQHQVDLIPHFVAGQFSAGTWQQAHPPPRTASTGGIPRPPPEASNSRNDEYFQRYAKLMQNLAYRYPNPGPPRERMGRIGGTWRHIKEVLGNTGSRVVFIDGRVSLYDTEQQFLRGPASQMPMRRSLQTPLYAPNRHDVSSYGRTLQNQLEQHTYKPWEDPARVKMPSITDSAPMPPMSPNKYKGFYTMRH